MFETAIPNLSLLGKAKASMRAQTNSVLESLFRSFASLMDSLLRSTPITLMDRRANNRVIHPVPQPSFLGYIRGNTSGFLFWVAIGWIVGGFMEEVLFRGFLLTRVSQLFADPALGLAVGIVGQALLFGALHLYAGAFAFVFATTLALSSGIFYLLLGRNLWPLIIMHGVWNTAAMWSVYSS